MIELLIWPMACGLIFLGLFALATPRIASRLFGVPSDSGWVQVAGVRDVFLGLAFILAYMHGSRGLVGELCLATVCVPLVDAWVTYRSGARSHSVVHLMSTVGIVAFGAVLAFTNW